MEKLGELSDVKAIKIVAAASTIGIIIMIIIHLIIYKILK